MGAVTIAAVVSAVHVEGISGAAAPTLLPAVTAAPPYAIVEATRIQSHLATVEQELLARDVSHLSAAQQAARLRHVQVLREYREAGVFPRNYDFPNERVPYFVDEHGTHCAMAYLIARSGGESLVAHVASTRNNARVRELADEPALLAWLDNAGLTVEEAARIQPSYGWYPPPEEEPSRDRVTTGYAVASTVAGALNGAAITLNLIGPRADRDTRRGIFGVFAGAVGVALGAAKLDEGGAPMVVGAANAGIGLASGVLGVRTLLAGAPDRRESASAVRPAARGMPVSLTPIVSPTDGGATGIHVRMSF